MKHKLLPLGLHQDSSKSHDRKVSVDYETSLAARNPQYRCSSQLLLQELKCLLTLSSPNKLYSLLSQVGQLGGNLEKVLNELRINLANPKKSFESQKR